MGIKGIYNEIGRGQRIALSKLALETYEQKGRPLRLAIDISIWLFQIQAGRGGSNPALRTFYYRLLRLISLSIHPLFVFDGPNKPPFKRNKRTGVNVASIPEFLAKQLLRAFGLPFHLAPGEAEAECALLQKKGVVDAVLSEDVDTLMFGSTITIRNWSAETASSKVPTHVNLYDAQKTKEGSSGLDSDGMILVAIMSGGDYVPEGIPGCGPKTACEAARAGFGTDLCKISRSNTSAIQEWKDRLCHELKTNESKYFRAKHKTLVIPEDFPRTDVLGYYTRPCVSTDDRVEKLRQDVKWDQSEIDIPELRRFTGDAFEWVCISGAKKFIRNLAPALLVKGLRLRAEKDTPDDLFVAAQEEAQLIKGIYQKRNHVVTDDSTELRIGFVPLDIVNLDLDAEEPDPETTDMNGDSDEEVVAEAGEIQDEESNSPKKKRAPSSYDPSKLQKLWVFETFVQAGVPLKFQDWEESFRNAQKYEAMKAARKRTEQAAKAAKKTGGMKRGALVPYARITKSTSRRRSKSAETVASLDDQHRAVNEQPSQQAPTSRFRNPPILRSSPPREFVPDVVDLLSSSPPTSPAVPQKRSLQRSHSDTSAVRDKGEEHAQTTALDAFNELEDIPELPPSVSRRRKRSPLGRSQSMASALTERVPEPLPTTRTKPPAPLGGAKASHRTMNQSSAPTATQQDHVVTPKKTRNVITIDSSPVASRSTQKSITEWFRPSAEPPTPSPVRKKPFASRRGLQSYHQGKDDRMRSGRPEFRAPLMNSTSLMNSLPAQTQPQVKVTSTDTVDATWEYRPGPEDPQGQADNGVRNFQKVICLRESLAGAWKEADVVDATLSPDKSVGSKEGAQKANKAKKKDEQAWRVSQVDILDLTEA